MIAALRRMRNAVKRLVRKHGGLKAPFKRRTVRNIDNMPFASDFMCATLPSSRLGVELVKGAILGFRRHSVDRFIKSLALYGNEALERSRLGYTEEVYGHSIDTILQNYIQRMPLDQLLVLYQLNLKCTMANTEVKYSFIEAISRKISSYMQHVTSYDTVGDFLRQNVKGLRTHKKRHESRMCDFLFQRRGDLLKCREEGLVLVDNGAHSEEGFLSFKTARIKYKNRENLLTSSNGTEYEFAHFTNDDGTVIAHDETVRNGNEESYPNGLHVKQQTKSYTIMPYNGQEIYDSSGIHEEIKYNVSLTDLHPDTMAEDCLLSTNLIGLVFCHIFSIRFWQKGFPFDTWINQYFAHNAAMYHPAFTRLYVANVIALMERNGNQNDLERICNTLKSDLMAYTKNGFFHEERILIGFSGQTHETKFGVHEMVEMLSTVKRLIQHQEFRDLYPWVVKLLVNMIKYRPIDAKLCNSIANVCNRNDGVGGVESLLQVLETKMLENIDDVTFVDVCCILQAMYKHDLHSQELVDTVANKLNTVDIEQISMSTLALCIQTLGRMQANFKDTSFLHRIADMFVCQPKKFIETSESNCSGILWGFYKLHFKHNKFLEVALQRYSAKDLGTPNVNSLVISLTALTRFDACNDPAVLIEIYKMVLRNICNVTVSTAQQLITCVTRMQENITVCCADAVLYKQLLSIGGKLINATMKHVCERLMDQISTVQAGAMLNALHRSRHRTQEIIAPLVASIAGFHRKGQDWNSAIHTPKKSILCYESLPPCPFDVDVCSRRLEKVEVTHLVGICEAIHGLDYWSPCSLHLMLQIKKHIKPQLHDMKATHILASCLSFVNWPFTDFQMDEGNEEMETLERPKKKEMLQIVNRVVKHESSLLKERSESWFDENLECKSTELDSFKAIVKRSIWKEEYLLNCIESLHRQEHFLSAASMPLRRLKALYDLLRYNVYIEDFVGPKIDAPVEARDFSSSQCPFLILEHTPPVKTSKIISIMPQNLISFQSQLYSISRTESFYNFLFGDGSTPNGTSNGIEEEEEPQIEQAGCMELLQNGKEVPTIRPLHVSIGDDESKWDFSSSCYHNHQGSGAILEMDRRYIYVDPVVGGFRTTLLLLDSRLHYIPHLAENIYKVPE